MARSFLRVMGGWRLTGVLGRAPAHLTSRNKSMANNEPARISTFASKQAPPKGQQMGPRAPDPRKFAGYERGVTAETLSKLCQQGQLTEAVDALEELVKADCHTSTSLFYTVLKECVAQKDLPLGRRVHVLTVNKGYESDTFLCNHILRMYASHNRLQEAMDVFSTVAKPDAFMWSSIISAHVKHGQDKQAIQLYHQMRRTSVKPDAHVYAAALQACAKGADLKSGQEVHADLLASGIQPSLFVSSCLVDMYVKCGSLQDARTVFDGMGEKNVVTWSAMISGYSQQAMGQEALSLYRAMQEEGMVVPDYVTFVCLLQACASVGTPALENGRQFHTQIRNRQLQADVVVANSLINMYAKCGSLQDARRVFDGLRKKNVVTWSTMIAGYSQQGMGQDALSVYWAMQEEGIVAPNSVTFVCLLQACASLGTLALEKGRQVHAQIRERGLQSDVFIASGLVDMYAKCGSLEEARGVFDALDEKNVVTWSAMIAAYSQQSMGQEALALYRAMQEGGLAAPNSVTFVCLLQACGSVGTRALEQGKELHAQIRERGLQDDVFVANSLLNMYAKCGSIEDAEDVFDGLCQKDVVTWNAMIAGYSQKGMGLEALQLLRTMQQAGMAAPNAVTFVSLLQACSSVGTVALEKGRQLHAQIRERGLQDDAAVGGSLVNMYAKCGSLEDARVVFDGLLQKNVGTWGAMISGHSQRGMGVEALRLYRAMKEEGSVVPDSLTFVSLLQACASVGSPALEKGKQLHAHIKERGLQTDVIVSGSLVNMYAKCGSLEDARGVFDGLGEKNVVTWSAMIAGYSQQGMGREALRLYSTMQEEGMAARDSVAFVCLLQACASVGTLALEEGKQLHAQIREQGLQGDVIVANSLVNMYAKCSSLEDAQGVFDGLTYKDVVTWSAMIAGYSQQGMGQDALRLYSAMQEEGLVAPNSVTFVCLLQACASVAALHLGRQLHVQIKDQGLQTDVLVAGSLINMYGKCGSMDEAQQVFEGLLERDTITWNALIAGYIRQGDSDEVFSLLLRMREDGIQPNGITFLSILTVCSHAGLVHKGREYFESMSRQHGITPMVDHYTCMVDLLGRAGHLDEALALVTAMPVTPNAAVWHTLLGACRKWSNVEVGRHAFGEAVKLDEKDAAAYVLMSNIYTDAEMWEQAHDMQVRRIRTGAWKQPGQSWWTDLDGMVHSFVVGNDMDPGRIQLFPKMKEGHGLDLRPLSDVWKEDHLSRNIEELATACA